MFQLLNRITWVLSITLGLTLSFLIFGWGGVDEFMSILLLGGVFTILMKYLLFSPDFIRERLSYFQEKLLEPLLPEKIRTRQEIKTQALKAVPLEKKQEVQEPMKKEEAIELENSMEEQEDGIPSEPGIVSRFFSENLLAKLGGILVFLGVLFLLSLVYSSVGPVAKMIIGFAIGFLLYISGVFLDRKGYGNEARILMGISFLVNYLVILGGRYLLDGGNGYLTVGATFLFLILNTLFAVTTSLVYNSRTLLIFAFVFAYINPLLLGESSSEPYTLLGYTMIVTLGALFLSHKKKDEILFPLAFIFASILFLGAPWSDSTGWIAKLLCINTLGALSLYVSTVFEKKYQYAHELLIGGTFFLIGIMGFLEISSLSIVQLGILGFSILLLMLFCYTNSKKGGYLYSIGTLGSVLTLSPAILSVVQKEQFITLSTTLILLFLFLNIGFIVQTQKELLTKNIINIVGGLLSGALFITYIIYVYGGQYFPGILQGFAYIILASVYSILAFFLAQKIGIQELKRSEEARNVFYIISSIGISFFTLAVAFVFSEHKEIISLVWLLESAVLFFLMIKTQSKKVAFAALILYIIGVLRLLPFFGGFLGLNDYAGDYGFLVALMLTLGTFIFIVYCISSKFHKNISEYFSLESYGVHHVVHTIGIVTLISLIYNVLDIRDDWYMVLYISIILCTFNSIYSFFQIKGLQNIFTVFLGIGFLVHLGTFLDDIGTDRMNLGLSIGAFAILSLPYLYQYFSQGYLKDKLQVSLYLFYTFFLSSFTVYHIFDVTFAVTLFWGILAFVMLGSGIKRDILPMRTLGLYLIILTAGKVFFYDIWMSVDDVISRVVALIVVGILMIILSTMYTKKYGNRIGKELSPENIFASDTMKKETVDIVSLLETTEIGDIVGVRMHIKGEEKPIQIRAKNLVKIAKIIEQSFGKNTFQAGELSDLFKNFSLNYKSTLPRNQYTKIHDIVEQFVLKGGKMEFVKNS